MFEKYYSELICYFSRTLYDKERAKDVVQEAYLRIAFLGSKVLAVEEPRAFLYKIAQNVVVDEWRKKRDVKIAELEDAYTECCDKDETLEDILSQKRVEALQKTIDSLPGRCKQAFLLHKLEGYSHKEVADMMGISKNAVEKHIIKALLACKESMEEFDGR